jgi:hypothetical protein
MNLSCSSGDSTERDFCTSWHFPNVQGSLSFEKAMQGQYNWVGYAQPLHSADLPGQPQETIFKQAMWPEASEIKL